MGPAAYGDTPVSEFDDLQEALRHHADLRRADQQSCENLFNLIYHALRGNGGPSRPPNNVTMDIIPDPMQRLRPVPAGEFYAAWYRLGLCEVLVRVRRTDGEFHGEYGPGGVFRLGEVTESSIRELAAQILRDTAALYSPLLVAGRQESLN